MRKSLPSSPSFNREPTAAAYSSRATKTRRFPHGLLAITGIFFFIIVSLFFVPDIGLSPPDFGLGTFLGLFVGLCISGVVLHREQQRTRQVRAEQATERQLLAIHQALLTLDLDTLLRRLVEQTIHVLPCHGVGLILLDHWRRESERVVTAGQISAAALDDLRRALLTGTLAAASEHGPIVFNSPQEIRTQLPSLQLKEGARNNLLVVPIRRQRHIGFFILADKQKDSGFSESDVLLLTDVAALAAVAIENTRTYMAIQKAEAERRELLHGLISAHEHERRRVAGEWHERFGEKLFQILRDFRACYELIVQRVPESKERFEKLVAEIDAMAALVRSLTNELHPLVLDDFGFVAALREYVTTLRQHEHFRVTVHADDIASPLPTETNLGLFRILQEAMLNIRRHAQANNVEIAFVQEHSGVSLMIKDDGQGFNPDQLPQGHHGILYMRERAEACGGTLRVVSACGQGTEVRVNMPRSEKTVVKLTQREHPL